jgi:hypothetical protein
MKQTITIALLIGMISCKKETKKPCNCGLIVSDDAINYSIDIRNECSNNVKTFYLTEGDWMNAHPGNRHCITNTTSW